MKLTSLPIILPFIVIVSLASAILYAPTSTPYSPWNNHGNGLSLLYTGLHARAVGDLGSLERENCYNTTVILVLNTNMTREEAGQIARLADCGATIIIGDSKGYSTGILGSLGIEVSYINYQVMDELSNDGERWVLRINASGPQQYQLVVPNATYVAITTPPNLVWARTTPYAYIDIDGNGYYSVGDRLGTYTVIAGWKVNNGTLILVPSTLFFINQYVVKGDNLEFLRDFAANRTAVLYMPTLNLTRLDVLKGLAIAWSSRSHYQFNWLLALFVATFFTVLWANQYIDESKLYSKRGSLITLTIILLAITPYLGEFINSNNLLFLTGVMIVLIALIAGRKLALSMAIAAALTATGFLKAYILLYILAFFPVSTLVKEGVGEYILGYSTSAILGYQIVSTIPAILYPRLLLGITSASIVYFAIALAVYIVVLRETRARLLHAPLEIYLGTTLEAIFELNNRHTVKYMVTSGTQKWEGTAGPKRPILLRLKPRHLGVNRYILFFYVTDPFGFSWKTYEPYTLEFNVLPLVSKLLQRVESAISGYTPGELLSMITVEVLITIEERGGITKPIGGEELAKIAREYGEASGEGPSEIVRRIIQEYLTIIGEAKNRLGEYFGAREYTPGDTMRDIHWKKSLGKLRLVSKEYRGGGGEGGAASIGGAGLVLIARLDCTLTRELDTLLLKLLRRVLEVSERDPSAPFNIILITGKTALVLKGPSIAVLNLLYRSLRENPLHLKYNYASSNRYLTREELDKLSNGEAMGPFKVVERALTRDLEILAEALARHELTPPAAFDVLHCRAYAAWASFITYSLLKSGYKYQGEVEAGA